MASIAFVIDQIQQDPSRCLSHLPIREVCEELKVSYRDRVLDPATTVALFIRQILNGNRSCAAVRHLGEQGFSAQAYCSARQRLPLEVVQRLSRRLCEAARHQCWGEESLFVTHRVFVVDGTTFSMPDTPQLQKHFGQPRGQKPGCGFPVAHLLALFDLRSGMLLNAIASPLRTHDLRHVAQMHPLMQEGDLLLGDTAFGSYVHFALLYQAKLHGLMPAHQQRIIDFEPGRRFVNPARGVAADAKGLPRSRWIRSLGKEDQVVEWFKGPHSPAYMSKEAYDALPDSILVREVRRQVYHPALKKRIQIDIVTTLLDEKRYPPEKLVELRLQRWQVEINLRHLKTTMEMDTLKCKSVEGVMKELAVFTLVYNLVRVLTLQAAARQNTCANRVSFKDVLTWIQFVRPGDALPRFILNAPRPERIEPRAIKRRPKEYDRLNRPRAQMRNALKKQSEEA
jgi:hypothetical protein